MSASYFYIKSKVGEAVCIRIFIYSRKSVYTGKGESIENQVELCRRYIADRLNDGSLAEITVYEDDTAILGLKSELQ